MPSQADRVHELEARCSQLEQELAEVTRSRDEFLSTVSHELRSPLTGMLLQLATMNRSAARDTQVPAQMKQRLERLQSQMRRFVRRATTLLDASRLASGRVQLHPETLDLSAHCLTVLQDFQPEAEHARTPLQVSIQPDVVGQWDAVTVEQVLANLVSNALKYGSEKPVGVTLSSDGTTAQLSVSDQGIGISAADLARVFERFERVTTARQTAPGFGVGLWVVRQLVEAMEGRISVSSMPGQGSTFTVTLPHETTCDPMRESQ